MMTMMCQITGILAGGWVTLIERCPEAFLSKFLIEIVQLQCIKKGTAEVNKKENAFSLFIGSADATVELIFKQL